VKELLGDGAVLIKVSASPAATGSDTSHSQFVSAWTELADEPFGGVPASKESAQARWHYTPQDAELTQAHMVPNAFEVAKRSDHDKGLEIVIEGGDR
jgi:hypothetical protein